MIEEATRSAFGKAIVELGADFPELVTIDADLAGSTKTLEFAKTYPGRAFNVGISEQDLVGTAAGLSLVGKRPFACSFAVFITGRGWEQIRNTVCTSNLPVTIVGSHAGILTGEDGETHQALEDLAVLSSIENIKIFSPADGNQTRAAVKHILTKETGPCYLRLGRANVPIIYDSPERLPIVKGDRLKTGTDLTILATGAVVHHALAALEKLERSNISAEVINLCCLKPIDRDIIIKSLTKTKKAVTIEDHSITGGLGSRVAEIIAEENLNAHLLRIGMHGFGESGTPRDLYAKFGLDAEGIYQQILSFQNQKK
jgi:transketolase